VDTETCYEWGALFASPGDDLVRGMSARASRLGLAQVIDGHDLRWVSGAETKVKYCFVQNPSDIESIRRIYNDDANAAVPVCFIVVRQQDPSETRGDIVFDIFRMSPESYLWHFYRVYTPPKHST
jgi:hypothetical protein